MNEQIIETGKARYISEIFPNGLPEGVINKVLPDTGGTTAAIEDKKHDTIVLTPTINLRRQKAVDKRFGGRIFEFDGSKETRVLEKRWAEYKDSLPPGCKKKIILVYDSFRRLTEFLGDDEEDLGNYYVLVDEYHTILMSAGFRDVAIQSLIDTVSLYSHVTYLSATQIPEQFELDFMKSLPHYKFKWNRTIGVKPMSIEVQTLNDGEYSIAGVISSVLSENGLIMNNDKGIPTMVESLHIFVNSIEVIMDIIDKCGIDPYEIRAVVSKSNSWGMKSLRRFARIEPSLISENTDKRINFYTSCAFEGCDIYTNNGLVIVLSSGLKENLMTDCSSELFQIAGRIRETPEYHNCFHNIIYHYYVKSNTIKTDEEFQEHLKSVENKTEDLAWDYNNTALKEATKDTVGKGLSSEIGIINKDGKAVVSELKKNYAKYQFDNSKQYMKNGVLTYNTEFDESDLENQERIKVNKEVWSKDRFPKICEGYLDIPEGQEEIRKTEMENKYPILIQIKKLIKPSECRSRKYRYNDLVKLVEDKIKLSSVFKYLSDSGWIEDKFYSSKEIKEKLVEVFNNMNIDKISPKSNLIEEPNRYFEAKRGHKIIQGDDIHGYFIKSWQKNFKKPYIYYPFSKKKPGRKDTSYMLSEPKATLCMAGGKFCTQAGVTPFCRILEGEERLDSKDKQTLFSECYTTSQAEYSRQDSIMEYIDFVVLDIDDGMTSSEFEKTHENLQYYWYPTFSNTIEHERFRVIIPLPKSMYIEGDIQYYKEFKSIFCPSADSKCGIFYYLPTSGTVLEHEGEECLNPEYIQDIITRLSREDEAIEGQEVEYEDDNGSHRFKYYEKALESIESSQVGERDNTIFRSVSSLFRKFEGYSEEWKDWIGSRISDEEKLRMFNEKYDRYMRKKP